MKFITEHKEAVPIPEWLAKEDKNNLLTIAGWLEDQGINTQGMRRNDLMDQLEKLASAPKPDPKSMTKDELIAEYNDCETARQMMERHLRTLGKIRKLGNQAKVVSLRERRA